MFKFENFKQLKSVGSDNRDCVPHHIRSHQIAIISFVTELLGIRLFIQYNDKTFFAMRGHVQ